MPRQTITLPAAGSVFSTQGVRESSVNSLVSQLQQHFRCALRGRRALVAACLLSLSAPGCKGRSVKYDNPVFEPAPPRRSLINKAADEEERRLMGAAMETDAAAETESGSDPASPFRSTSMQRSAAARSLATVSWRSSMDIPSSSMTSLPASDRWSKTTRSSPTSSGR